MPERIRRERSPGWRMPPGARYVGRPSRWGSPFPLKEPIGRDHPLRDYLERALGEAGILIDVAYPVHDVLYPVTATVATAAYRLWLEDQPGLLAAACAELRGLDLACWCPEPEPGQPDECHAAILLKTANAEPSGGRQPQPVGA